MSVALPSEWRMVRLGACLTRRTETVMPATLTVDRVNVVGLEDIEDAGRGGISILRKRPSEIESLKTVFHKGDILYGRLRPYLNKVGIASDSGLCSTEIWAFAPESFIDTYFAYAFLSSTSFVQRVSSLTKGANLPRLDIESFESIEFPLPPLSEQRKIIEILQEAERIRRLHATGDALSADLIPAVFNGMFGDPATYQNQWPLISLNDALIEEPKNGLYKPGSYYGSGTPIIRIGDFYSGRLLQGGQLQKVQLTEAEVEQFKVADGDILLNRVNSIEYLGKSTLVSGLTEPSVFESNMMRLRPNPTLLTSEYLIGLLQHPAMIAQLRRKAKRAVNQASVNQTDVLSLRFALPPLGLQQRFVAQLQEVEAIRLKIHTSGKSLTQLVNGLLARAFTGELTTEWRDRHKDVLQIEAGVRDEALKASGVATAAFVTAQDVEAVFTRRDDGVYAELSLEQHAVLEAVERTYGGSTYPRWFNAEEIAKNLNGPLRGNRHAVEGHLAVLAARGLVIAVSREEASPATGEIVFGNAYRLPLANFDPPEGDAREPMVSDHARLREMERLVQHLEKKRTS